MKTAVVILNWNTREYLERFVPSMLESIKGQDAGLFVIDNGSSDGSVEFLKKNYPQVRIVELVSNFGFAGGYNHGLQHIIGVKYFVLVNSDIEVSRGWLNPLVDWMDEYCYCAACGPKILSYNNKTRFEYAGAAGGYLDRFGIPFCRGRVLSKTDYDRGQYDIPAQVHWASGACMIVRASVWDELGGFDERFFAHMEEIDWCWRARLLGYSVWNVPQSKVYHIGGGTLDSQSPLKLKLNYRNSLITLAKNLPLTVGRRRAKWRLFLRMLLDGGMYFIYLVTFRWKFAKAVRVAHSEYRAFEIEPGDAISETARISGKMIVPAYILMGKGVFKYLQRHEDNN